MLHHFLQRIQAHKHSNSELDCLNTTMSDVDQIL